MIKVIKNIHSVKEFKFLNDSLVVLTENNILKEETEVSIGGEFYCIRIWKNFLLTQNKEESNILILDENFKVVKEISGASNYALWLINDCSFIPIEDRVFKLSDSLNLDEIIINVFPKDCTNNFGIRRAKNSVLCDNINSNQLQWKFELGEDIKVGGDFLIINQLVVISTTKQDLIAVEIETGKELWRLSNCNLNHQCQPSTNYLASLSANSFGDNIYQIIDPVTGKKLVDKQFENFLYETTPKKACITKTHYYFVSNILGDGTGTKSEMVAHLGCINLQTHEIEWIEKIGSISDRRNEFQKLEVQNNKFYLLDGEHTLHICEK